MRKMMIFLIAAVLVAGCVGQTAAPSAGDGLQITSFTSDTDEQFSGRDIRLYMEAENGGDTLVKENETLIYLSGPIGSGLLQWQLVDGDRATSLRRDLDPHDPIRDIPPGRETIKWTLRAPQMEPGQEKTDTFTARAYYDYETRVVGEFTAYSEAESIALRQKGDPLETSSFSTSAGPIGVSVDILPDPVVVYGDDKERMTLQVTIENTGGGTLYKKDLISGDTTEPQLAYDDLNIVTLELDAGELEDNVEGDCEGEHELIGGKPTTISCDIEVPKPSTKTTFPLKISLGYGYYIDSPITLTAVGKR